MIAGYGFSEKFNKSWIAKLPSWAWWIIFYVVSIFSNYFMNDATINQFPYLSGGANGSEIANMWWAHLIMGVISVVIFELIATLYGSLVLSMGRAGGGFDFTRKDFVAVFRLFYILAMIISGGLQFLYYYNTIIVVFGSLFFTLIPRMLMVIGVFFFFKKKFLNEYNTHVFLRALFVPYFAYEIISIVSMFVM